MEFFRGLYNAFLLLAIAGFWISGVLLILNVVSLNHYITGVAYIILGLFALNYFRDINFLKRD